jgi:hypothetical protein
MTNRVDRSFSSTYDNQSHLDDHPAPKLASVAKPTPRGWSEPPTAGAQSLTASRARSATAEFARKQAMPAPKTAPEARAVPAGLGSDAAKAFLPRLLGPAEPVYKVAALCVSHPAACATAAGGAMVAGAGYLVAEAVFGAEAGPVPPPPGGSCAPETPTQPQSSSKDPCEQESSLECLPRAFRDGVHN